MVPVSLLNCLQDDVEICVNIGDINSFELLQDGFNAFSRWASEWQLKVSINKCAILCTLVVTMQCTIVLLME
jgi:hypothetical protein